jgi:hypothetical protein
VVLRHFAPLALLYAAAMVGSAASLPSLTVQISSEIAPVGGWVQIKVILPVPQLITKGELVVNLDPTIFGTTTAVATFSAAGDAWGSANISTPAGGRAVHFAIGRDWAVAGSAGAYSDRSGPGRDPWHN